MDANLNDYQERCHCGELGIVWSILIFGTYFPLFWDAIFDWFIMHRIILSFFPLSLPHYFAGLHQPNCYSGKHGYVTFVFFCKFGRPSIGESASIANPNQMILATYPGTCEKFVRCWSPQQFLVLIGIFVLRVTDRLSGVMDDRGKFIYISTEEMKAVAEYIRKQGRVSISHLANNSNQFIDLEPKAQYEESQQDDSAAAGTDPWEFLGLAACSILLCFCAQGCSVVTS